MGTKKIALVLSGGAFNGAFQMGALRYIKNNWKSIFPYSNDSEMKFDIVTGISVGTLNGVFVASDKFDELETFWEQVAANGVEEIFTSNFIDTKSQKSTIQFDIKLPLKDKIKLLISKKFRNRFFKETRSLADNLPLKQKIQQTVKREYIKSIFKCGFTSLDDGQYFSLGADDFETDEDFQNAILASTVMPIVWVPVKEITTKNGTKIKNAVDGGVKTLAPLGDAIDETKLDSDSEYTIVIINCCNHKIDPEPEVHDDSNIGEIALRSVVIIPQNKIINNDLECFLKINDILAQLRENQINIEIKDYDFATGKRKHNQNLKEFKAVIIEPDLHIMGDELVATRQLIEQRISHGLRKAEDAFKNFVP